MTTMRVGVAMVACALGWLAGCGEGSEAPVDGPDSAPAPPDSGPPAASGPMSLRVHNSGLPLPNLAVVFHDADGEVLGQTTTDADGVASGEVTEGGMVTVIGGRTRLTVAGVEPGDDLLLGYPPIAIPQPNHQAVVTYQPLPEPGTTYRFDGGCGTSFAAQSPAMPGVCVGEDGTFTLVATAEGPDGHAVAYAVLQDVPAAPSGTTDVTLTPWQTDRATASIELAGVPEGTETAGFAVSPIRAGLAFGLRGATAAPPAETVALAVDLPPAFGDSFFWLLGLGGPGGQEDGSDRILLRLDDAPPGGMIDTERELLPRLVDLSNDGNAARPTLHWSAESEVAGADVAFLGVGYTMGMGSAGSWYAIVPPETGSTFQFPDLPAALRPTAELQSGSNTVAIFDADHLADYDEARAEPLAIWIDYLAPLFGQPPTRPTGWSMRVTLVGEDDPPEIRFDEL